MSSRLRKMLQMNPSREYLAKFAQRAAQAAQPGARVLDAGAGDCPYSAVFSHARYETTDFCQVDKVYGKISFISNLANLPVKAESYDLIFCSQTMEHLPAPGQALAELHRVLRPGGQLWLSAPLFFMEHEAPYDFYRYTRYGMAYLLDQAGFEVESIEWLEGYFGTLSYQLRLGARAIPVRGRDYGGGLPGWIMAVLAWPIRLFMAGLSIGYARLDLRKKYTANGMCKNYAVIAHKRKKTEVD